MCPKLSNCYAGTLYRGKGRNGYIVNWSDVMPEHILPISWSKEYSFWIVWTLPHTSGFIPFGFWPHYLATLQLSGDSDG